MNRQQITESLNKMRAVAQKAHEEAKAAIEAHDAQKSKADQEQTAMQN